MAHSRSAKKRIRQNAKRRARNRWRKSKLRSAIKDYRQSILHGGVEEAQTKLNGLYKMLDQVASKGTIHRNAASRYKSRLADRLNQKKSQAAPAGLAHEKAPFTPR